MRCVRARDAENAQITIGKAEINERTTRLNRRGSSRETLRVYGLEGEEKKREEKERHKLQVSGGTFQREKSNAMFFSTRNNAHQSASRFSSESKGVTSHENGLICQISREITASSCDTYWKVRADHGFSKVTCERCPRRFHRDRARTIAQFPAFCSAGSARRRLLFRTIGSARRRILTGFREPSARYAQVAPLRKWA